MIMSWLVGMLLLSTHVSAQTVIGTVFLPYLPLDSMGMVAELKLTDHSGGSYSLSDFTYESKIMDYDQCVFGFEFGR